MILVEQYSLLHSTKLPMSDCLCDSSNDNPFDSSSWLSHAVSSSGVSESEKELVGAMLHVLIPLPEAARRVKGQYIQ